MGPGAFTKEKYGTSEAAKKPKEEPLKIGKVKMDIKNNNKEELNIEIEIGTEKKYYLLQSFILFCIVAPFIGFILIIIFNNIVLEIGYLFTFIIFWGTALYFARLYLWNRYGIENYSISRNKFCYHYDYKYFKDNKTETPINTINVGFLKNNKCILLNSKDANDINDGEFNLVFYLNNSEMIVTESKVNYDIILKISDMLADFDKPSKNNNVGNATENGNPSKKLPE